METPPPRIRPPVLRVLTWVSLAGALLAMWLSLRDAGVPGWDEAGHSFSALRMAESARTFDPHRGFAEFVRADHYPPLGRLGMSLGFLIAGDGWSAPRAATCVAWILALALSARLARRIGAPEQGDLAAFMTVALGLSCWLGAVVGRCAMLEAWSMLSIVAGALAYLKARETGSPAWAVATGVSLVTAILVKYSYGPMLLGAVGLSALYDVARPGPERETLRLWPWALAPVVLGLLWWFVLPFPAGLEYGAAHRARLVRWVTQGATLPSLGPEFLVVVWGLMCSVSLPAFALQVAGVLWGLARWRHPTERVCAILAVVGPVMFVTFPFRVDRFLLPTLFGAWVLAGGLFAALIMRAPRRARGAVVALFIATLFATSGLGGPWLVRSTQAGEWSPEKLQAVEDTLAAWRNPYAVQRLPATGPAGTRELLDHAARHLQPEADFGWIGGAATELSYNLVQWRLFQASGHRPSLYRERREDDYFWHPPNWNEGRFRQWAEHFPQVVTLDPPDPRDRGGREYEKRFVEWMRRHPRFRVRAAEQVQLDEARMHTLTIYERLP